MNANGVPSSRGGLLALAIAFLSSGLCGAGEAPPPRDYYVDAARGSDANSGLSAQTPFASVQRGADLTGPGDTLWIAPGVYYEQVRLHRRGTAERPITIKSSGGSKETIITGADRAIREGKVSWELLDPALQLYAVAYTGGPPARVLYSGADLYPYGDLDKLKTFTVNRIDGKGSIGPRQGYAWDLERKLLYVRLYPDGTHGPTDPSRHTICVAPPTGEGFCGILATRPEHANFTIPGDGSPAYLVIDGFTFETPGIAGLQTLASQVTVQNCRFVGCRGAVAGNATLEAMAQDYRGCANAVTVRQCIWTQYPVYDDGLETIAASKLFWQRKHFNDGLPDNTFQYETGMILRAAKDWDIHHNYIHDAFEGFSSKAMEFSENARVHDNLFVRLLDNAIETEDHSRGMHFYRNVIVDTFVPISWQPLEGEPWPGPFYCYRNVMYATPRHRRAFAFRLPPVFKIGATEARKQYGTNYVVRVAEPGLLFFNNSAYWPDGSLLWGALFGNNPDQVKFYANALVTTLTIPDTWRRTAPYFIFTGNLCVNMPRSDLSEQVPRDLADLGFCDAAKGDFRLRPDSVLRGRGMAIPETDFRFPDLGAVQSNDDWLPPTEADHPGIGPQR